MLTCNTRSLHVLLRRSLSVLTMMMFIPRGWNLFFSGTGTADFHPEVLEKARPISPLAEIRQNNSRKNCGNDLNSTLWFAPFYCRRVCPLEPRLLTFSDQKILCRIRGYSFELRCYSVMNEITATPVVIRSEQSEKAHRICSGVQGSVHHRCGSVGSGARPNKGIPSALSHNGCSWAALLPTTHCHSVLARLHYRPLVPVASLC